MDKEPVQVHFFQTSTLPILEFSLGCKNKEAQAYLIGMAVALIDKAKNIMEYLIKKSLLGKKIIKFQLMCLYSLQYFLKPKRIYKNLF